MIEKISITDIYVGQFLLSRKKLLGAIQSFAISDIKPFSYRTIDNKHTLTDGHHTAFVAYLHGVENIEICFDNDSYDWNRWELSTQETWQRNVIHLPDFIGRVVDHDEYVRSWIEFCDSLI